MGAKTQIQVIGLCLPVANCSEVTLCLQDCWIPRTVNGTRIAFGTIVAVAKADIPVNSVGCLQQLITSPCFPCGNVFPKQTATKTTPGCAYTIEIDLDQFLENPDTELPWTPVATDLCELSPYPCEAKALLAAQLLTNLDCTLERDSETGQVGIPATAEPTDGATEYLGFDADGCSVRVKTVAAARQMTEASTSLGFLSAGVPLQIDFDGFLFDTLNPDPVLTDPFVIVPGADCHILFPVAGVYEIFAQVQFTKTAWGHNSTNDFVNLSLLSKLNTGSQEAFALVNPPGFDTGAHVAEPVLFGSRKFVVAAGDEMRLYAQHTDSALGNTTHALAAAGTLARLEVTKIH